MWCDDGEAVGHAATPALLRADPGRSQDSPRPARCVPPGGRIVDYLADEARELGITLYAQAKLDNPAAVKTHHADRWVKLGEDDTYAYFRTKQ